MGMRTLIPEAGVWTPEMTFATPGDLSVAYASQDGSYNIEGRMFHFTWRINCTPTHTTASGPVRITGLPFACASDDIVIFPLQLGNPGIEYAAGGRSYVFGYVSSGWTELRMVATGDFLSSMSIAADDFATGVGTNDMRMSGAFPIK